MDFTIRYISPEQFKPVKVEYDIFFTIGSSMMYSMGHYNKFPFDLSYINLKILGVL